MWRILQQETPDDFVIATGEVHSLKEFIEETFSCLGLNWQAHVETSLNFFRPSDINYNCGDASKAKSILGWEARHKFHDVIRLLVDITPAN
jgi:GDPmannose 4,6-dehydratase